MAKPKLKIAAVQLNPVVGDIPGNVMKIRDEYRKAVAHGPQLVVCPELSVTGYPLEDLANHPDVLTGALAGLQALAAAARDAVLLVGAPVRRSGGVYNAAFALHNGDIVAEVHKRRLPNYGVFDEKRNFTPDPEPMRPFTVAGCRVGVIICEDAWSSDAANELAANGAELLVAINASPFRPDVLRARVEMGQERVGETGLPFIYVNTIGGQDEVVFDGGSFMLDSDGKRVMQMPQWEECARVVDITAPPDACYGFPEPLENIWRAMMQGVGDYVRKSGFTDVVLGLSGGIDSALVAAVAGDALGPEHTHCVRLPSKHTSDLSNDSAARMCEIWGFSMETVPIGPVVEAAKGLLSPAAGQTELKSLTLENMQARARGYLLMSISNDRGWMLLSTGNKSEIGVGYATLYGDMCGGFNPLKDVYKTTVFALSRWRNSRRPAGCLGPSGEVIPVEIIDRPPSAELAPGQKDTDSLPPYEVLDGILEEMVENQAPRRVILEKGYDPAVVARVYALLKRAEYKRRQGAPGPKTTPRAFARDRRTPIVNGFDPLFIPALERMAANDGDA
ncbi:MAG: NAD+ synthase [Planctomycetes bacterium]|nr:NAD+ synthase [Planctomycetota bacterium]